MRFELTPLTRAAIGLAPDARNSKPNRVRFTINQKATPKAAATSNIPYTPPPGWSSTPNLLSKGIKSGMRADSGRVLVVRLFEPSVISAKYCENKNEVNPPASEFNMIVEITSLTPRLTFK